MALVAGCGGGDEPDLVPAAQADALHEAVVAAQPVRGCANVRRPMTAHTRRAYALLGRTTGSGPDLLLQSADFADLRTPMREYAAGFLDELDACLARTPRPGAGWRAAATRLRAAIREA